jgi:universal stress protein E
VIAIASILVAVDANREACDACDEAGMLARTFGARVDFVHVIEADRPFPDAASELADELRKRLELAGTEVGPTVLIRVGDPADELVGVARERASDLIVLGAGRKTSLERLLLGSTAEAVIRRSPVPVWLVPPGRSHADVRRIVCAIDESPAAREALAAAAFLARTFVASLTLVNVVPHAALADRGRPDEGTLPSSAGSLDLHGIDLHTRVEEGAVSEAIVRTSESEHCDLVVVGSARRRGLARLRRANTAERLARRAPCSILAVPAERATQKVRGRVWSVL